MKTILCYGDSNTYGYIPESGMRYARDVRWTGILANKLSEEYTVIEEGCNGRTTVFDDPVDEWRNGETYLKACLNSHKPLDFVILMLGSNDMKKIFNATAKDSANGVNKLIAIIKSFTTEKQGYEPKIILVSPAHITKEVLNGVFDSEFDEKSCMESTRFSEAYSEVAMMNNCIYLDAAKILVPSKVDGLHFTVDGHKSLANALYQIFTSEEINI